MSVHVNVTLPGTFLDGYFAGTPVGRGDLHNEEPEGRRLAEIAASAAQRNTPGGRYATFIFTLPQDQGALDYLTEMAYFVALHIDDDPALKRVGRLVVERCETARKRGSET